MNNIKCNELEAKINSWDKKDVKELKTLLTTLSQECKEKELDFQGFVQLDNLPTHPVLERLADYGVFAIDDNNNCLVSDCNGEFDIESAESILDQ